jgi:D-hydroxyproline dehydrogenase subunit beta
MAGRPDALVIGAGVVGAAVAFALSRAGLAVEVIDAGFAGGGVTAAAMGHVVVMDDSEAQFALTSWSRRLLAEVADEIPSSCELDRCGTLWLARDDDELHAARARQRFYAERGVQAVLLDEHQLAEAEPHLRSGLAGALLVPDDAVVYPPALAWWLLARAADQGARLRTTTRVEAIDGREVICGGERLQAGLVVNAAGPNAGDLTPGLAILPRKGHLAITDRHPGLCRHQLVELGYLSSAHTLSAESVAFNVQPRTTGQLLIGSSRELVGWDSSVNRRLLGRMLEHAVTFLPALAATSVIRVWTGFRPATPDNLPLIGRWDEHVWIAAGHEGLGITTALGTGALLADLVTERTPAIDPSPFTPRRPALRAEVHA